MTKHKHVLLKNMDIVPSRATYEVKAIYTKIYIPPRIHDFEVTQEWATCDTCGGRTRCRPKDDAFTVFLTELATHTVQPLDEDRIGNVESRAHRHMICHTRTAQRDAGRALPTRHQPLRRERARLLSVLLAGCENLRRIQRGFSGER